jgi:hypothetical protein
MEAKAIDTTLVVLATLISVGVMGPAIDQRAIRGMARAAT